MRAIAMNINRGDGYKWPLGRIIIRANFKTKTIKI